MTPYRETARVPRRFTLPITLIPSSLVALVIVLLVALVLGANLARRTTSIECARAERWMCTTTVDRAGITRSTTSRSFGVPESASLVALDDGGGALVVRDGAETTTLATFTLDEVGVAYAELRRFAEQLSEPGATNVQARVREKPTALAPFATAAVILLLLVEALLPRSTIVVEDETLTVRPSLLGRAQPLSIGLSKLAGVVPGPDLDILVTLTDGSRHRITAGLTKRAVARRATQLRDAIERARLRS